MSLREVGPHTYVLEASHTASRLITKNYRWYTPAFSPREIPIFADVSSITESPETMKAIRDFLVARYRAMPQPPTHILGFDARGFLFGPMIAVELGIPFVLMRKADKNAGLLLRSEPYEKDYKEDVPEFMTVRIGSINKGSRVVLIDDVLATGGTSTSGLQLVEASGATLVELVFLLFAPALGGVEKIHSFADGRFKDARVISFVSDDALTADNCGDAKDYTGPRVEVGTHTYLLEESHELSQLLKKNYRWYSPAFSPRDVPRFADVSSITESPETMKAIRDFLVARYRAMPQPPTHILGFDARGFLFGPMIAVELGIPFVLMRKAEKNAGLLIKSEPYDKEYKEAAPEVMTVRIGSIDKGSRVVLIDDVLATGGTALSGLQLVEASGADVVEMVSVLSIPFLRGVEKIHSTANGRYKDVQFISLISEDALTEDNCADSKNYTGPRVVSCGDVLANAAN